MYISGSIFTLKKLGLIKTENEKQYPTVSAILLSEREIKQRYFPYAKIECARFKGTKTDATLDSKTIDESICSQPDLAVAFVERTIKKGSKIGRSQLCWKNGQERHKCDQEQNWKVSDMGC